MYHRHKLLDLIPWISLSKFQSVPSLALHVYCNHCTCRSSAYQIVYLFVSSTFVQESWFTLKQTDVLLSYLPLASISSLSTLVNHSVHLAAAATI
jgi:hypothetical protein